MVQSMRVLSLTRERHLHGAELSQKIERQGALFGKRRSHHGRSGTIFLEFAIEGGFADAQYPSGHDLVAVEPLESRENGLLFDFRKGQNPAGGKTSARTHFRTYALHL